MKRSLKFPKQLFVAKYGDIKYKDFEADVKLSKLMGFVDEQGNLEVGVYELIEVKKLTLVEDK